MQLAVAEAAFRQAQEDRAAKLTLSEEKRAEILVKLKELYAAGPLPWVPLRQLDIYAGKVLSKEDMEGCKCVKKAGYQWADVDFTVGVEDHDDRRWHTQATMCSELLPVARFLDEIGVPWKLRAHWMQRRYPLTTWSFWTCEGHLVRNHTRYVLLVNCALGAEGAAPHVPLTDSLDVDDSDSLSD